jgi:hypothetical protein
MSKRRVAIAVLAVKATRFAGGFAGLDRGARRWLLAYHILLLSDAAHWPRSLSKRIWMPLATPTRRSHAEGAVAKRRSGGEPLDGVSAVWLPPWRSSVVNP